MNKEHSRAVWSRAGGVSTRLGYVLYTILFLLISAGFAFGFFEYGYETVWEPLLWTGVAGFGTLLALEVVRRILMYVIDSKPLFSLTFPKVTKFLVIIPLLCLISAPPIFGFYDQPKEKRELAEELAAYQQAKEQLPSATQEAQSCFDKQKAWLEANQTESSECRRERLGYQACIEVLQSRASCLSSWDYESACSRPNFSISDLLSATRTCFTEVNILKNTIGEYEISHPEIASPQ